MAIGISYYLDEHVPNAVARGLRQRGVDVVTVNEEGMQGATDRQHLDRARQAGRVVFTMDDDFLRMHAESREHSGIVYAAQGRSTGEIVRGLMLIRQVMTPEEMQGSVEFL